jgi:carboxylesterase type B
MQPGIHSRGCCAEKLYLRRFWGYSSCPTRKTHTVSCSLTFRLYKMRFFRLTLIMQVQCMLANAATVDDVKNKVRYHGTSVLGVEHYQNIKYAHDTSGDGRFSPPISYKYPPSSEVDATSPSVACPQSKAALPPFFAETDEISEDCLTLRIARPAGTISSNRLPVVV